MNWCVSNVNTRICTTNQNHQKRLTPESVRACGNLGNLGDQYLKALKDLAEIDAHSEAMASSLHYDLSEMVEGPLIKKSIRSFWTLNKRMPVAAPEEDLTEEEWKTLKSNMGKRGKQSSATEAQLDEGAYVQGPGWQNEAGEWVPDIGEFIRPAWSRKEKYTKIQEYGREMLNWYEVDCYKNWMFHTIAEDLWNNEGLDTSYFQVRYVLKGK